MGSTIYVVGNLGYLQQRISGETPVYRLDLDTWAIERIDCQGENPGWIHGHKAGLAGDDKLAIRGGHLDDGSNKLVDNLHEFVLDLTTRRWTRNNTPSVG